MGFHADEEPRLARRPISPIAAYQRSRRAAIARPARRRLAPIGPVRVVDAIAIQDAPHHADVIRLDYQQQPIRHAAEANAISSAAE